LLYRALAMVFSEPPHCTPVPKKSRSLQLYILVECKRQGAFLKISAILSLGSIIVSKVLKCNSLSLSLNLQRVEQCLDVGIKSLQATSLGLSKKCITIKCIFLLLCDFIGFWVNFLKFFLFRYLILLDFEWIYWICVFFFIMWFH
jgi:hypothetical protein